MLYHVSGASGLRVLKPRASSHGKPYVYAVDNVVTGLLFGARHDDFDFSIDTDEKKRPALYECYPGAFDTIYTGKACSVYEVDEGGFLAGVTGWSPEYVCDQDVPVRSETRVNDLHGRLLGEAAQGNLTIHRYEHTSDYKKRISEHIVDRLIRFGALDRRTSDERFQKYYRGIIDALLSAMDGHLL